MIRTAFPAAAPAVRRLHVPSTAMRAAAAARARISGTSGARIPRERAATGEGTAPSATPRGCRASTERCARVTEWRVVVARTGTRDEPAAGPAADRSTRSAPAGRDPAPGAWVLATGAASTVALGT